MRIAPHEAARQLDPVEQHLDPFAHLGPLQRAEIMDRFGHLLGQRHLRVERGKGILKDHLHVAPRLAQGALRQ